MTRERIGFWSPEAGRCDPAQPIGLVQLLRMIEAVDTLGAGDTFIARTLFGLLERESPGSPGRRSNRRRRDLRLLRCRRVSAAIDLGEATAAFSARPGIPA